MTALAFQGAFGWRKGRRGAGVRRWLAAFQGVFRRREGRRGAGARRWLAAAFQGVFSTITVVGACVRACVRQRRRGEGGAALKAFRVVLE